MKHSKTLLLAATMALFSLQSNAGEVSGGSDSFFIAPAYFRTTDPSRTISICYETSSDFGVPTMEIESEIRWAFKEWSQYIEDKDLKYAIWTKSEAITGQIGSLVQGCKGTEDLRVYFGVQSAEVQKHRPRYSNPFAFSAITETSSDKHWSKGILWFANTGSMNESHTLPIWNKPSRIPYSTFKHVVLHEVGHIFGNGHVDNTVMSTRIGQWLGSWASSTSSSSAEARDLKIDQGEELVPNLNLSRKFALATDYGCLNVNGMLHCNDPEALSKAFIRIFGYKPSAQLSAAAIRHESPNYEPHRPNQVENGTGVLEIIFNDNGSEKRARIITTATISKKHVGTPLFDGQYGNHYSTFGISFYGYIEGTKSIPVVVNYNMGNLVTIVDLQGGGTLHPLFTVKPYWQE